MRAVTTLILAAAALLSACTDEVPTAVPPQPRFNTEFDTGPMGTTEQYWRSATELWVYDNTTELGFNNHLPNYSLYQTNINQIRWGGARLMRVDLDWKAVDPTGYGGYPPTNCATCPPLHNVLDNFRDNVERALNTSVVPVVMIHGTPDAHMHYGPHNNWQGATDAQLATSRAEFTRFVRDMVALVPGVNYWQIMNEVDAGHWGVGLLGGGAFHHVGNGLFSFDRRAQAKNYALLMQSVYPAVKQANPNAWVIMSGLTGSPYMDSQSMPVSNPGWQFLDEFYLRGGGAFVDIMAVHAYGRPTSDPDGFTDKSTAMLSWMNQHGDGKRPLWLTEFGRGAGMYMRENNNVIPANAGPTFDNDQSSFFANALYHLQYGHRFHKAMVYSINAENLETAPAGAALPNDYSCGNDQYGNPKQQCEPADYSIGLFRTDGTTSRPAFQTIAGHGINHNWLFNGYGYGDIVVYSPTMRPIGYSYTRSGSQVTIHGVHLNKLYPKPIHFENDPDTGGGSGCEPALYC